MRDASLRFAIALLVAVLAAVAFATTTRPVEATCPACDHEFTALELGSTNTFGGRDLDLCVHANGEPPDSYYVWVCPACLYAEWEGDFADPLSDEEKERLRGRLTVDFEMEKGVSQRDIPGWVKYELLLQHRALDEAPPHQLAWAALRGAWVVRLESGDALRSLRRDEGELGAAWDAVSEAAWTRINDLPTLRDDSRDRPRREVQVGEALVAETAGGALADDDVARRRLYGAWLLRCRGELADARPVLQEIVDGRSEGDALREAAVRMLEGVAREESFLERFVHHARVVLATADEEGYADQPAVMTYQVGDVLRRLGRTDAAADRIVRALEAPGLSLWNHEVACESLDRIDADRLPPERREQLRRQRFERVLDELEDPDTSEDAYHTLRALADPAAIPRVVAALSHESDEVRAYAALTLKFLPELPDSAIDALCTVLIEDLDDPEYRAAVALVAIGSPRAREAFLVGIDSGNERVRELCVEGLATTGEPEDVPRLLELVDVYPRHARDVAEALSFLTCRPVKDLGDFRTWWEEHAEDDRAAWVRERFLAADLDLAALPEEERVPRLIDLLWREDDVLRCAALRRLRELTGRSFGWDDLADGRSPRAVKAAVAEWRAWWADR